MRQAGDRLDLTQETVGTQRMREVGLEHLESDSPPVTQVACEVDCGHAAAPELALEDVAAGQGIGERRVDCGHGNAG